MRQTATEAILQGMPGSAAIRLVTKSLAVLRSKPSFVALSGTLIVIFAWFLFSFHDASIKLLVDHFSSRQILLVRSLLILPVCLAMPKVPAQVLALRPKTFLGLVAGAIVYAAAWVAYYAAARGLQLVELETIYYSSPLIGTVLAMVFLKERPPPLRLLATLVGFGGVIAACNFNSSGDVLSIALAIAAAVLWAVAMILVRCMASSVSTGAQMAVNNLVFVLFMPLIGGLDWQPPDPLEWSLLIGVAICGACAQFLLYEGVRRAPISLTGPLEFTGLVWAFLLGLTIWGDLPTPGILLGMGCIVASGSLIILDEYRQTRPAAEPTRVEELKELRAT